MSDVTIYVLKIWHAKAGWEWWLDESRIHAAWEGRASTGGAGMLFFFSNILVLPFLSSALASKVQTDTH